MWLNCDKECGWGGMGDGEAGDMGRGQAVKVCTWPFSEVWVLSQGSEDPWKSLQAFGQSYRVRALTLARLC